MKNKFAVLAIASVFTLLASSAANACAGKGEPVLDDNFKTPDTGWNFIPGDAHVFVKNSEFIVKPDAKGGQNAWNANYTGDNTDTCATIRFSEQKAGAMGLTFWIKDNDNLYTAVVTPDGSYTIYRKINGTWGTIKAMTPLPAIKPGPKAVNEIELQLNGPKGTLLINDKVATDFHGQPPANGGMLGVRAENPADADTLGEFAFTRYSIYNLK